MVFITVYKCKEQGNNEEKKRIAQFQSSTDLEIVLFTVNYLLMLLLISLFPQGKAEKFLSMSNI